MLGRPSLLRLVAALLLAMVGLQAGVPAAQPLQVVHGSAFSADTLEVALAAHRRAEPARQALTQEPALPPTALVPVPLPARPDISLPAPRPASTAPPARELIARRPAPRAPPLA